MLTIDQPVLHFVFGVFFGGGVGSWHCLALLLSGILPVRCKKGS